MEVDRSRHAVLVDQNKLSEYGVGVVGQGTIANVVLAQLLGLGVSSSRECGTRGKIYLIDDGISEHNPHEFLLFGQRPADKRMYLEDLLLKADLKMRPSHRKLESLQDGAVDVLVDLTNCRELKGEGLKYCKKNKIPFISASADDTRSSMAVYIPGFAVCDEAAYKMNSFKDKKQGICPSGVIGTLVTEELKKLCMGERVKIKNPLLYNLRSSTKFGESDDLQLDLNFSGKHVLVVGAGGSTGTWYCIAHALNAGSRGNKMTIVDFDDIEPVNLNRQILYCWDFKENTDKVSAIKHSLNKVNPGLEVITKKAKLGKALTDEEKKRGAEYLDEAFIREGGFDLIVGCVDNNTTREFLNRYAVEWKIPYIDASVDMDKENHVEKGWVVVYVPGESICHECTKHLNVLMAREKKMAGRVTDPSCANEANASIIMPNASSGMIAANEARLFLSGHRDYDGKSCLCYSSEEEERILIIPKSKSEYRCKLNCH